jgi:hypothetical protein
MLRPFLLRVLLLLLLIAGSIMFSQTPVPKLPHYLSWTQLQRLSNRTDQGCVLHRRAQKRRDIAPVYVECCTKQKGVTSVQYLRRIVGTASLERRHVSLLHLVLYSGNSKVYTDMHRETSRLYAHMNIETLYYTFRTEQEAEFVIEGDRLYIKGEETYVPGILDKTLRTLQYTYERPYDFLIRSNVSTVVNFAVLLPRLLSKDLSAFHYGGSRSCVLQWLDPVGGLVDATYFGTTYVEGTCLIFSKSLVCSLLKELSTYIPRHIVDDVALGVVIQRHTSYQPQTLESFYSHVTEDNLQILLKQYREHVALYRHKTQCREEDVKHIRLVTRELQNTC